MENPTQFDLNDKIRNWREQLESSPAFRDEDVQELESHLRDSVARLQAAGLSSEEAFWVAVRRVGPCAELTREYGKVHAERVWISRLLWMVAGSLLIKTATWLASELTWLVAVAIHQSVTALRAGTGSQTERLEQLVLGVSGVVVYCVVLAGFCLWCWRSIRSENGLLRRVSSWMKHHATLAATVVGLLLITEGMLGTGAAILVRSAVGPSAYATVLLWVSCSQLIGLAACLVFAGWLLARCSRQLISD